ncbi:hypothetical protein MNB_SUP05-5-392 [hydrothermal vent metagenome]|uniref:Tetratricopeptide repeat protein n=1 Tax=hydrothermal vent metagenome TaxID=652676 RepID=A0A1W1CBJ7_9ZZZZ
MPTHSLVKQYLTQFYNVNVARYIKQKKYKQLKQIYLKLINISKTAVNYQNLAIIMFNYLDEKKQSVYYFKQAIKLNPNLPQVNNIKNIIKRYQ